VNIPLLLNGTVTSNMVDESSNQIEIVLRVRRPKRPQIQQQQYMHLRPKSQIDEIIKSRETV